MKIQQRLAGSRLGKAQKGLDVPLGLIKALANGAENALLPMLVDHKNGWLKRRIIIYNIIIYSLYIYIDLLE